MKEYIVNIDTGTTNTRVFLWDGSEQLKDWNKENVGVRNTAIDGNNKRLLMGIKKCMEELLERNHIVYEDVRCIVASGMITSNLGLVEIPHCTAPAGQKELAEKIRPVVIEELCPLPIWFIPGIKNDVENLSMDNITKMDIMRGEEVEAVAVLEHHKSSRPDLLILPGSHTKFIYLNENGQVAGCMTSIAGELLSSVIQDTIIADAVGKSFLEIEDYQSELVIRGFEEAAKFGLGRTCFSGRIMNQFLTKNKAAVRNFIYGAVLQGDLQAMESEELFEVKKEMGIVVCGQGIICQIFYDLLKYLGYMNVTWDQPEGEVSLAARGAWIVAKEKDIFK